jgi:predicted alpha/beta hydrolase family esterase
MAAQYGLDSNVEDVAATLRTLGRVHSPAILVGHSYGGTVITAAGTDDRVAGLVYICALGPDETETSQGQQDKYPKTPVFSQIDVADGRVWLKPSGIGCFCGDLPEEEQQLVYATHYAPAADLFLHNAPGVAWRTKPSWCIVGNNDQAVHPDLERASAKRIGATTYDIDSSTSPTVTTRSMTTGRAASAIRAATGCAEIAHVLLVLRCARKGNSGMAAGLARKLTHSTPPAREAADLGSAARFILE